MPPVYPAATAAARLQATLAIAQSQTPAAATGTASAASLVLGSSAFTNTLGTTNVSSSTAGVLAIIPIPVANTGVSGKTLTYIPSASPQNGTGTSNAGSGGTVATQGVVINNAGTIVSNGYTVGTSGADININGSTTLTTGETVTVNSFVVTHP